ncbi:hypothetical protein J7E25_05640 [Agromyces sp. ISL-38]|uniref:hypothetical protein n=1 Tax=Agromyces sp. ISL-38 TaxID=2819107 RepID=UPI001BEBF7A7|nr:hypothetical protein [Agromyces sp. ISL-38]MBT2498571.1 hypothetical protein [Agromyces sp. ISL-38]
MADYKKCVAGVLGGAEDARSVVRFATRLRFAQENDSEAEKTKLRALPGVTRTATIAEQFHGISGGSLSLVCRRHPQQRTHHSTGTKESSCSW